RRLRPHRTPATADLAPGTTSSREIRSAAGARASDGSARAPARRRRDRRRRRRGARRGRPAWRSLAAGSEGRLDPVHVRAQLAADVLDLRVGLLGAHAQEVLLAGAVLGDPLAREVAVLDLLQDLAHRGARLVGDHALAARIVAVLGGVGDRVPHPGQPLLVHQVGDQLELVQALEVGHLGVVAGVDERLEPGLDELGGAAAQNGLLAEQVGLGLVLEGRLDHAAARAADALGIGQGERASVAGRILLYGDQAGDARPFGELAADEMTGALGRDHSDVDPGWRLDLVVVDREAVAEQDHVALGDAVADLALPQVV